VNEVIYWGRPLDWHNQTLTPNPDAIYFMAFYDTKDVGPIVFDIPPGDANASLNGNIVTVWQTALEDVGLFGIDRGAGGRFMYDKDYFMLPDSPNGRTNIGTVSLDADELKFATDGSLRLHLSHDEPADADAKANWLPAPEGQFALIVRAYVPTLDGSYQLPNVERTGSAG